MLEINFTRENLKEIIIVIYNLITILLIINILP